MKLTISASLLLMLAGFGAAACSSENSPSTSANGGSTSSANGGAANTSGGATSSSGGAASANGGATTANGGATGSSNGGSTASTSGGATSSGNFMPSCTGLMASGAEPTKGGPCTASDPQVCYKTCGPASSGFKSETCTGGVYAEGACEFPAEKDYSCYKIPAMIDRTACGTTTPKASTECMVPECTLCNDASGQYQDSSGAAKTGYCVCGAANSSGVRKWTCASATAWPCPNGKGC
ncbi:MAG: hypothetical protein ACOY0T_38355 [Myxococcota bacterium]